MTRTRARKQHSRVTTTRLPLDELGVEELQSVPGTADVLDNDGSPRGILVSPVTRPSAYHYVARTPEDSEGGGAAAAMMKVARLGEPKFRQSEKPHAPRATTTALCRIVVAPIIEISTRRDAIGIATHRATSVVAARRNGRCTRVTKQNYFRPERRSPPT